MRYEEIEKGKIYFQCVADKLKRKRGQGSSPVIVRKMLVVDKNEKKQEILASCIPEKGLPTAPQFYTIGIWKFWQKEKPNF